jgi:hypothetical protein
VTDDLIDGRQVLRTDDLERREMMAIQLDEARSYLVRGTVVHARLAFILLDNAAEVIMRRNVEVALSGNMFWENILERWQEILDEDPGNAEAIRQHDEVKSQVVSKRTRKALAAGFDAKVGFLCEQRALQETEARVLKKLHKYRNELYHRDRIRAETIRSACLLYFDLACTLFETLVQAQFSVVTVRMQAPEALRKFAAPGSGSAYPTVEQIAAGLRSGLGIDDAGLGKLFAEHLTARLDDLDAAISWAVDMLFGELPEGVPSGPWRRAVIHHAQWKAKALPESLDELLDAKVAYEETDLASWRQRVADLQEVKGRLELFAAFVDIEDAFEPFEELVMAFDQRIDREIQHEEDIRRGK